MKQICILMNQDHIHPPYPNSTLIKQIYMENVNIQYLDGLEVQQHIIKIGSL